MEEDTWRKRKGLVTGILLGYFLTIHLPTLAGAEDSAVVKGKSVYMEVCKVCHGMDGRGAGTMKFNPPAADLTGAGVQGKLDAGLFESITMGARTPRWEHGRIFCRMTRFVM